MYRSFIVTSYCINLYHYGFSLSKTSGFRPSPQSGTPTTPYVSPSKDHAWPPLHETTLLSLTANNEGEMRTEQSPSRSDHLRSTTASVPYPLPPTITLAPTDLANPTGRGSESRARLEKILDSHSLYMIPGGRALWVRGYGKRGWISTLPMPTNPLGNCSEHLPSRAGTESKSRSMQVATRWFGEMGEGEEGGEGEEVLTSSLGVGRPDRRQSVKGPNMIGSG